MKITIEISEQIYENIKSQPDDMCDSMITRLIRVHDLSTIEVFKAIKNSIPQEWEGIGHE